MPGESDGRIFFSNSGRTLEQEDEIKLVSVGVDIGSSTSHLVFSRITLERLDARYVVTGRDTFHQSDILLTPYAAAETIDADRHWAPSSKANMRGRASPATTSIPAR